MKEIKENKSKVHYTLMLISDDPKQKTAMYHLPKWMFHTILTMLGVLIIAATLFVSITNYNNQLLHSKSVKDAAKIEELEAQVKELASKEASLEEKSKILTETVSMKLENEAVLDEKSEPTGYPLSGTADYELKTEPATKEDGTPTTLVGLEFKAPEGTIVTATGAGMVTDVHEELAYGYQVVVDHGNGYISIYRSGTQPLVKLGDEVSRGAALFVMNPKDEDDTAATVLYYQINRNGEYIDPTDVLVISG